MVMEICSRYGFIERSVDLFYGLGETGEMMHTTQSQALSKIDAPKRCAEVPDHATAKHEPDERKAARNAATPRRGAAHRPQEAPAAERARPGSATAAATAERRRETRSRARSATRDHKRAGPSADD